MSDHTERDRAWKTAQWLGCLIMASGVFLGFATGLLVGVLVSG